MKTKLKQIFYAAKISYNEISTIFWTLLFPIILCSLFHFTFSNLQTNEFEKVKVGIDKNNPYIHIFKQINLLDVNILKKEDAKKNLESSKISSFIGEDNKLLIASNGVNTSVVKQITDQINIMVKSDKSYEEIYAAFANNPIKSEESKMNLLSISYYAVISMISLYGAFNGLEISKIWAKKDANSHRMSISSVKTSWILISFIIVTFIIQMLVLLTLMIYIDKVLAENIFTGSLYKNLLIFAVSTVLGASIGIFFGVALPIKNNLKEPLLIASFLILSTFNGMMGPGIRAAMLKNFPPLEYLNPTSLITNSFMEVNILKADYKLYTNLSVLMVAAIVFILISILKARRGNHANL
ncbi:ABC transporter permease [Peptoniphilaceae bacterium SGI.131]